jgi:hypothetical protein
MHEEAKEKLSDVPPENNFRMKTGEEIRNLHELLKTLQSTGDESFSHHVNDEKNDFASWIRYSVGDSELADKLMTIKDLDTTRNVIEDRISFLKRRVEIGEVIKSIESFGTSTPDAKPEEMLTVPKPVQAAAPAKVSQPVIQEAAPQPVVQPVQAPKTNEAIGHPSEPKEYSRISEALGNIKNSQAPDDLHPFEHLKRNMHLIIRDVLFGFSIGMVVGLILGYFVW